MSDLDNGEDEAIRSFLPSGFGKQSRVSNTAAQIELSKRPSIKTKAIKEEEEVTEKDEQAEDGDEDDDDDEDEEEDNEDEFPVSHELIIKTHERAVTTATIDPSGSRLITGSTDCTLKLHDFSSMSPTTIRAFRSVDPTATKGSANVETHPVHQVMFNPISPRQVLVVTALPQAKILDRDGEVLVTFVKGDMYLRDMHNTKGHISEVTSGTWHPNNKNLCVTAGTDSTLRIWDVNNPREQKDVIVHKSRAAGSAGRTRMTAVAWGSSVQGGNSILVSAAYDGSLAMWGGEGPYHRPAADIRDAHTPNTWTSGLEVSADGRLVVTRGGDDMIKLWDVRKFKTPVSTTVHKSTSDQYPTSTISFSPNGTSILVGSPEGSLHILNPATLKPDLVTPVTPGSCLISAQWHASLNQIMTTSANSEVHLLYNPKTSTGGAKLVLSKTPKRRHIDDDPSLTTDTSQGIAFEGGNETSFAARHPTVGLTNSGRPRDPRRPHVPHTTPFSKSQPDEDSVRKNIPLSSMRDEDPREALLKYAGKAETDKMFTNAWAKTQPKTIYAEVSDDEEEKPDKKKPRI